MLQYINQIKSKNKKEFLILLIILLIAIVFRIFLMRFHYAIGFDEPHYLQLAASFRYNDVMELLHPYWSPMYPFFIAIFSFFFKNIELSARLVSVVSGSLVVLPVYFLSKKIFNEKVGLISAFLLAVHPSLAFSNTNAMPESFYTMITILGIYLAWKVIWKKSIFLALSTGFLFGSAYLSKPEGLGYFIVFLGFSFLFFLFQFKRAKDIKLNHTLIYVCIGFLIVSIPYIIYLYKELDEWTISTKWHVNQRGIASGRTEVTEENRRNNFLRLIDNNNKLPADMAWHEGNFHLFIKKGKKESSSRDIINNIKFVVFKLLKNNAKILTETLPSVFTFFLLILFGLGLFANSWTKENWLLQIYLISCITFFWFIVIPFFHITLRYFIPLFPLCFIWIGKGMEVFFNWVKSSYLSMVKQDFHLISPHIALIFSVFLYVTFSFLPEFGEIIYKNKRSTDYWAEAYEMKEAGKWLKKHCDEPPILMNYNKAVDYYAGQYDIRKGVSIPDHNFQDIMDYAKLRKVDYIVLSSRYTGRNIEKFKTDSLDFLLEVDHFPEELKMVYEDTKQNSSHSKGIKTRIFKVLFPKP